MYLFAPSEALRSHVRAAIVISASLGLTACSTSISRFDFPVFGLTGKSGDTTAAVPVIPAEPVQPNYSAPSYQPENNGRVRDYVQRRGLPDVGARDGSGTNGDRDSYTTNRPYSSNESYGSRRPGNNFADRLRNDLNSRGQNRYPQNDQYASRGNFGMPDRDGATGRRSGSGAPGQSYFTPSAPAPATRYAPAPASRYAPVPVPGTGGTITVAPGDTLYSISRRTGATQREIMNANGMDDSSVRGGQVLRIPGKAANPAPAARPTASSAEKIDPTGYLVKKGDTLYSMARKLGVSQDALASYNGLTDYQVVRRGQRLKLPPKNYRAPSRTIAKPQMAAKKVPVPIAKPEVVAKTGAASRKIRPNRRVASLPKPAKPAIGKKATVEKAKRSGKFSFRWPVRGRIISKFGPQADGSHNDGINVAVPHGAKVKAAEAGVVAYAGSELKGYGNLILIRHGENWVSAYAHNSKMLVKRGDKIKRGQIIASAGNTGSVKQPQLHFELRRGSKPTDPLKYMSGA